MQKFALLLSATIVLGACSYFGDEQEKRLEGDRLSITDFERSLQQGSNTKFGMDEGQAGTNIITLPDVLSGGEDKDINLAPAWNNKFWPQVGGYPTHAMKHLMFNEGEPKRVWSKSIGAGGTKRMPLISPPIMADNKIFTLNNDAEVITFDATNGNKLWSRDIAKPTEDEVVIGGGLGFSGGKLYATNGFNEVIALDPKNGSILWRSETKAPIRAAPSAIPGHVIVTTLSNETIALDGLTGDKLWSHRGLSADTGLLGASTPAITRDTVITTYGSGEVYALQIDTGTELWSKNLSPVTRVSGQSSISDIQALPVIDNNVVYAASSNNRMHAIDMRTGQTIWQIALGTNTTPWISGNRLYVIDTQSTLISLNRENGNILWQSPLQPFTDMDDKEGRIRWTGPILASNRLMVIGSHGEAQDYNPADGSIIRTWDINDDVLLSPAMANGILYTLNDDGRLSAWR